MFLQKERQVLIQEGRLVELPKMKPNAKDKENLCPISFMQTEGIRGVIVGLSKESMTLPA